MLLSSHQNVCKASATFDLLDVPFPPQYCLVENIHGEVRPIAYQCSDLLQYQVIVYPSLKL